MFLPKRSPFKHLSFFLILNNDKPPRLAIFRRRRQPTRLENPLKTDRLNAARLKMTHRYAIYNLRKQAHTLSYTNISFSASFFLKIKRD
jgi:hypothetical protein